jgi:hypothetical protein
MATSGNPFPDRLDTVLPRSGRRIWRTAMFDEQQSTTWLKHTLCF